MQATKLLHIILASEKPAHTPHHLVSALQPLLEQERCQIPLCAPRARVVCG